MQEREIVEWMDRERKVREKERNGRAEEGLKEGEGGTGGGREEGRESKPSCELGGEHERVCTAGGNRDHFDARHGRDNARQELISP